MNSSHLRSILQQWAEKNALNHELEELDAPPPLLDTQSVRSSTVTNQGGLNLTLLPDRAHANQGAQLGIWLKGVGGGGSYALMEDGADEIETYPVPAVC